MKKLFSILIVLLFALPGWGATYYVMPSGTVSAANKAQATACANDTALSLTTMNAATFLAGDIIDGCSQTYTSGTLTPHDGSAGAQITYRNFNLVAAGGNRVYVHGKANLTFTNVKTSGGMFYLDGASTGNIVNNCIISDCTNNWGLYVEGTSSLAINNSNIFNNYKGGIYCAAATASITANNIMVVGNGLKQPNSGIKSIGSFTIDYSIVTGNNSISPNLNWPASGITDGGHNLKQYIPRTVSPKTNKARFVLTIDDQSGIAFGEAVHAVINGYGVHFSLYPYTSGLTAGNITSLKALISAGHEVGLHSRTHTDLTKLYPFTVTSTNIEPTVDVDIATTTITLGTSTAGNTVTLDWSGDKNIGDLKTAVAGKGWTITTASNTSDSVYLKTLADTSGAQAVGAGYQTLYNQAAFWDDEIGSVKTWMTTNIGTEPTTIAYPFGASSAPLIAYIKDTAALIGARTTAFTDYFSSVNIFAVGSYQVVAGLVGDGAEATLRANARGIYTHAIENGQIAVFLVHSGELTAAQVGYIVDEIQKCGGTWVTFKDLIADIKSDHSTADNITYTKTYTDVSDLHLKSGSPAINAGVAIDGLTTDADGKPIAGKPDIGAYERRGKILQ